MSHLFLAFIKQLQHIDQPQNGITHQSVKRHHPILKQKALRMHNVKETWSTLKKFKAKTEHIMSIAPKIREWGWAPQISPSLRKQNTTDKSMDCVKVFLTGTLSGLGSMSTGQKEIVGQISLRKTMLILLC